MSSVKESWKDLVFQVELEGGEKLVANNEIIPNTFYSLIMMEDLKVSGLQGYTGIKNRGTKGKNYGSSRNDAFSKLDTW
nr:8879_t:CDS:2 [Entrophospora candida]